MAINGDNKSNFFRYGKGTDTDVKNNGLAQEIILVAWFAVVLLAFFAPQEVFPPNIGVAAYGLFLVLGIAALTLCALRQKNGTTVKASPAKVVATALSTPPTTKAGGTANVSPAKPAKSRQRRDTSN